MHIVDFENKNSWFEQYLIILSEFDIDSQVVAINKNPYLQLFCLQHGMRFSSANEFLFDSIMKKHGVRKIDFLISHGYKPSLFALILSKMLKYKFMVVHHHQPNFFRHLRSRNYFKGSIHSKIASLCYRSSFAIQSFSSEVSEALLKSHTPQSKVFFNPIGINLEPLQEIIAKADKVNLSHEIEKNVVSISRLSWEKNLPLAIEAIVLAHQSDDRIRYSIYGDGPQRELLLQLIKDRDAEKYIHLKGFENGILPKLKDADLFLHTSLTESYGQVIFEAFFVGTPILTSRVGVSIDIEKIHEANIQIFLEETPSELAKQIIFMLNKKNRNRQLSNKELEFVEGHSVTSSVSNLVTFLNREL